MPFKFNPFTGQLDFYQSSSESTFENAAFYDIIEVGDEIVVPENKFLMFSGSLILEGDLEINGKLVEV
jgi:hypothetical protein